MSAPLCQNLAVVAIQGHARKDVSGIKVFLLGPIYFFIYLFTLHRRYLEGQAINRKANNDSGGGSYPFLTLKCDLLLR